MLTVLSAVPASAATITVTNLNDSGAGSLRDRIASASSGDTINFSVAGTITLSSTLSINTSLTISGPGVSSLAVSGNNSVEVFAIGTGITVTISGLTIQNGSAIVGGDIDNAGTLTVTNCTFSGNSALSGGGISNESGTATVTNCTFSGNSASGQGGGINNAFGGTLTVTKSTFVGNTGFEGGAINNDEGPVTVINSTFSGNSTSQHGGAINNDDIGPVIVTNSTVSGNSACSGCGGGVTAGASGATTILQNTIVANSPSGGNCAFTITDGGGNLSWPDTTCPGINVNPMLDPSGLQNNGGPTKTIALLAGSPAIGADVNANCPATDQRGVPRPSGQCDIGAYQLVPFLSSGSFVIGDLNAAVGNTVTFWGAKWAKDNSLSGGPAPNAFKGFADQTTPAPPACGGSWTSDPGNSSNPPDSVPSVMPVIVSSSIDKSGATISGDVPKIVIIQTNPGYGPSPGHAGTGTVVAVLCGN